mgnify:CR=1 FL=1
MKLLEKIKLRLICGALSLFIGSYLGYICVRAFIYRETFFSMDSEFPVTQAYFYQLLGISAVLAIALIGIPIYFYYRKKK